MQPSVGSLTPHKTDVVEYACDPRTRKMEARRSTVQGQLWLHNKFEASLGYLRITFSHPISKTKSYLFKYTNKKQGFFFFFFKFSIRKAFLGLRDVSICR